MSLVERFAKMVNTKVTSQKIKLSFKNFFSKCFLRRIWSHLPKKSLMKNLIFFAVSCSFIKSHHRSKY